MFLSQDELRELTGYQRAADQLNWIKRRGWKHEVNALGRPILLRSYVMRQLGEDSLRTRSAEPDFSFISKAA